MLLHSGVTTRSSFVLKATSQMIQKEVTLVKETVADLLSWRYNNVYAFLSSNKFDLSVTYKYHTTILKHLVLLKPITAHRVLQINAGIRLASCRGVRAVTAMANMDSTHTYSVCVAGWRKSLKKQAPQMRSDLLSCHTINEHFGQMWSNLQMDK